MIEHQGRVAAYLPGIKLFILLGGGAYLAISIVLRRFIPRDQCAGMALFRRRKLKQAVPHFEEHTFSLDSEGFNRRGELLAAVGNECFDDVQFEQLRKA